MVTDTIALPGRNAYACMLGGEDRRTLFICTAPGSGPERAGKTDGKIECVRVAVAGAGLP
jgi:sugar lactone lactonase YvrE